VPSAEHGRTPDAMVVLARQSRCSHDGAKDVAPWDNCADRRAGVQSLVPRVQDPRHGCSPIGKARAASARSPLAEAAFVFTREGVWERRLPEPASGHEMKVPQLMRKMRLMGNMPRLRAAVGLTLLCFALLPLRAIALPLTLFRYEDQAQRYCPADTVVWLDLRKRIYYSRGQRYYGHGFNGSFVCQNEARSGGYRRSLMGLR
jgi:hypothetical protein